MREEDTAVLPVAGAPAITLGRARAMGDLWGAGADVGSAGKSHAEAPPGSATLEGEREKPKQVLGRPPLNAPFFLSELRACRFPVRVTSHVTRQFPCPLLVLCTGGNSVMSAGETPQRGK